MITQRFDEEKQNEQWRNLLAKELNLALSYAALHSDSAGIIESLVSRIADFEEIETVEKLNPKQG